MKKILLFTLCMQLSCTLFAPKLNNHVLKSLDQAGFFDKPIIDILQVRQKIKDLIHGKFIWQGLELSLETTTKKPIKGLFKKPETIYGLTFVTISSEHPDLHTFVATEQQHNITKFLSKIHSLSHLQRQDHTTTDACFTGSYAIHPFTKEKLPIYVTDFYIESFDIRKTNVHFAVPAHNTLDFEFAHKHQLPIKLVLTGSDGSPAEDMPKFNKDKTQITEAFTKIDTFSQVIHSDFLNGSIKQANQKISTFIQEQTKKLIAEYQAPVLYKVHNQECSIEQLITTEKEVFANASQEQKENMHILMNNIQADFLEIVEPFMISVHGMKTIMIDLIAESCELRKNKQCYLLKWSQIDEPAGSERTVFKRDITTIQGIYSFCIDLVDFLGDLASSCTHALDNLKKIKQNK